MIRAIFILRAVRTYLLNREGRRLWATYSSYLPKFTETRLGSVRPYPTAPRICWRN